MRNLWPWGPVTESLFTASELKALAAYPRLCIGFSGGLDSTVLLHALAQEPQLAGKLFPIHVHHGLSVHASDWEAHCLAVCQGLNLQLRVEHVILQERHNLEARARTLRYAVFQKYLQGGEALLLGHHRDDQAETLLLQLCRGAGVQGLAAMPACKRFAAGFLLRPLLALSRQELEQYAKFWKLSFITDESNEDCRFARNFIRHEVIPLLETRWVGVKKNLAEAAMHCREASENLAVLAEMDLKAPLSRKAPLPHGRGSDSHRIRLLDIRATTVRERCFSREQHSCLSLNNLKLLPPPRINNILRHWLQKHQIQAPDTKTFQRLLTELILAKEDKNPEVGWGDYRLRRYQDTLYLFHLNQEVKRDQADSLDWPDFPNPLIIPNLGILRAEISKQGLYIPKNSQLSIRFRQGGETIFLHGQTKRLKKLFQEWQLPPWQREHVPLLYFGNRLVAVVGYAIDDNYASDNNISETCYQLIFP